MPSRAAVARGIHKCGAPRALQSRKPWSQSYVLGRCLPDHQCQSCPSRGSARNWNYPEDVSAIMCLHSSRDSARNWNHPEDVSTTRIELHSCHVVIHEHDAEHLGSITFTIALTAENIVVEDVLKALLPSVPNYEYFLFVVPSEDGEQTQFIFSFICRSCCLSQAHIPPFMRTRFGNSHVYVCLFS